VAFKATTRTAIIVIVRVGCRVVKLNSAGCLFLPVSRLLLYLLLKATARSDTTRRGIDNLFLGAGADTHPDPDDLN